MKIVLLTTDNREHNRDYNAISPYFGTAPTALLEGFAALPEIEVHVVSCVQLPVASPKKIAPNIFYHSVVVPKIGWMRTLYQGCIRAIRKKLNDIKPDIVHGQGTERDCAISAVFSGFPNVLTVHGNMRLVATVNRAQPFSFLWLAAKLEGFTLSRTDGVVSITNYTRSAVENLTRRTWVLPNAVDTSFFDLASPVLPVAPTGLCVGQICPRKNQNAFIRALDPLAQKQKFKLIFVGAVDGGAYGTEFLGLIKTRPWCEHVPFSSRERIKELFSKATALALPTLEDNCPMVVLEAMAAGVPVLASNVGGLRDLITPEKTGLFCDPQNPDSFTDGMERLLTDATLRQRLATAAKIEARQRFHPKIIAQRHVEIYREVLANKK